MSDRFRSSTWLRGTRNWRHAREHCMSVESAARKSCSHTSWATSPKIVCAGAVKNLLNEISAADTGQSNHLKKAGIGLGKQIMKAIMRWQISHETISPVRSSSCGIPLLVCPDFESRGGGERVAS